MRFIINFIINIYFYIFFYLFLPGFVVGYIAAILQAKYFQATMPGLPFLVPFTMGPVLILGKIRGHLPYLWRACVPEKKMKEMVFFYVYVILRYIQS